MPKREEPKSTRSKMTVMVFQLEGSDDTVQEGLRKISQAVENAFQVPKFSKNLIAGPSAETEAATSSTLAAQADEESESDESINSDDDNDGTSSRTKSRKAESTPEIVEIDRSKASTSLPDFFSKKLPGESSLKEQVLVIAYWLKHHAKISEFSVDQMYTLLRELDKSMGSAPRQALRNLKSRRFINAAATDGLYTGNSVGESLVDKLPKQ